MTYTIYTLGDVHMMEMVLNSVAMIFNPSQGLLGGGGSLGFGIVIGVAFLLSLVFALLKIFQNQQRAGEEIKGLLTVIVLAYVFVVPKSTVQIEDIYTGQVATVDNVPTGIALTGSLLSGFSRSLAERIEVAFQSVSSAYVPLTEATFGNPFQISLNIYNNFPSRSGFIKQNIRAYMSDCFSGSGSDKDWMSAANVIDYITDPANRISAGSTTYYSSGVPDGELVTCADAANRLKVEAQNDVALTSPSLLDAARYGAKLRPDGSKIDSTDIDKSLTLAEFISNANASQVDVTTNLALGRIATCAKQCLGQSANNADYAACNTKCAGDTLMGNTLDQFMIDSAANASIFQKVAIPMMSLLLGLFYALTPIVVVVAAAMGTQALGYLGKFFMFGVWTQSFLPMAALINAIAQTIPFDMMSGAIAGNDANPATLTLEETVMLKEAVRNRLIAMTELMAYAPLISMAVLTGSYYGLTQLANRISNNDRFNEKSVAPDVTGTAPIYQPSALMAGTATQTAMMTEAGMSYTNNGVMNAVSGISINGSEAASAIHSRAQTLQNEARQEIREASGMTISKALEQGKVSQLGNAMSVKFSNSESKEVRDTYEEALDLAEKMGFRGEYAKQAAAIMTLGAATGDQNMGKALAGLMRFAKGKGAFSEKAASSFFGVANWGAKIDDSRKTTQTAMEINEHLANDMKRWGHSLSNSSSANKAIAKGLDFVSQGSAGIKFSDQERAELGKSLSHAEAAIEKSEDMEQQAQKLEMQGTLKDLQIVRAAGNGDLVMGSSKLKQLALDHGATQEDLNAIAKRRGFHGAGSDGMAALYYLNQQGHLGEVADLIGGKVPHTSGQVAKDSAALNSKAAQLDNKTARLPDEGDLRKQREGMAAELNDKGVAVDPSLNTTGAGLHENELMATQIYNNTDADDAMAFVNNDASTAKVPEVNKSQVLQNVRDKGQAEFDKNRNTSTWDLTKETVSDMAHSDPALMSIMAGLGMNKLAGAASDAINGKELKAIKEKWDDIQKAAKKIPTLSKARLAQAAARIAGATAAEGLTEAGAVLLSAAGVATGVAATAATVGVAAFGAAAWSSLTDQEQEQVKQIYEKRGAFEAYKAMAEMAMHHWNSDEPEQPVAARSAPNQPVMPPLAEQQDLDSFARFTFGAGDPKAGTMASGGQAQVGGITLGEGVGYFNGAGQQNFSNPVAQTNRINPGHGVTNDEVDDRQLSDHPNFQSAGSPVSQPQGQKRRYTTRNVGIG
ncbi:conjugal transfer protein TraG [Candidatus Parcubacteria bacterium]|nr:MAG: conjugal transfer protein TraG [Candidatus Parcubacteria bacterium]